MKDQIIKLIYKSIEEYNLSVTKERRLELELNTVLYGNNSQLDSLGLANLLLSVENQFNMDYKKELCMVDSAIQIEPINPFLNVDSLATFLKELALNDA